jgi:hypothetical protein
MILSANWYLRSCAIGYLHAKESDHYIRHAAKRGELFLSVATGEKFLQSAQ